MKNCCDRETPGVKPIYGEAMSVMSIRLSMDTKAAIAQAAAATGKPARTLIREILEANFSSPDRSVA
jgi:predicted DNA binding CopG/RHH family protein